MSWSNSSYRTLAEQKALLFGETERVVLSDPDYWQAIEAYGSSIEIRLTVAGVEVPAWVVVRGGTNAYEIGARLELIHSIRDRSHWLYLELGTTRGLLREQVEWPPELKAPSPNAWHRALTDLRIIG